MAATLGSLWDWISNQGWTHAVQIARAIAVPVVLLFMGMYARRLGRRDNDQTPRRNDWALATTLLLMTASIVFADLSLMLGQGQGQGTVKASVAGSLIWLLAVFLLTFVSLDHDRSRSWEVDKGPPPVVTDKKRIFLGIILPDLFAILVCGGYQFYKISNP